MIRAVRVAIRQGDHPVVAVLAAEEDVQVVALLIVEDHQEGLHPPLDSRSRAG